MAVFEGYLKGQNRMPSFRMIAFCSLAVLTGCGLAPKQAGGDILVIGDSVLAWNHGTVGRVVASETGRKVVSRAALGAQVDASAARSALGLSIPGQLSDGPWNWIIMDGGANDLVSACGCAGCDDEVDTLISADGSSGSIPALISGARATGAQVLWMGYYQAPESASFANCRASLVEMERRIEAYAKSRIGIHFVDAETVVDPLDPRMYSPDMTHPSRRGSEIIGSFLAQTILAKDGKR